MEEKYNKFKKYLTNEENTEAIKYALDLVKKEKIKLKDLYENIIYKFLKEHIKDIP